MKLGKSAEALAHLYSILNKFSLKLLSISIILFTCCISQTKEFLIISGTFTYITNLPITIITADVNAHLPLWYSPTKDHREKLIEGILLNSNHITLNKNTPTHLPFNQTQQPTSDQTFPCHMPTKLVQLRSNKSSLLQSYLHSVIPDTYNNAHYPELQNMTPIPL